ncbi:MAG: MOSC domain-containing protein [Candidatus Thiodiazotropha sp. (ex Monitilora ramsayi)]|nr:MOSC domain-containing protein [Candidatus Thiodiazotropha sp. (ex Monitilora ramsayi)]
MNKLRLSAIYRYPVKSLAGENLQAARVDTFGLENDRRWMVVDPDGEFLTQRELPRMTLIGTEITGEGLQLQAPGMPSITLEKPDREGGQIHVRVWNDRCPAQLCADKVHVWLSDFLNRPCRLVHMADETVRQVDPKYATQGDRTAFADGFPLLLISQASLDDLNSRLTDSLPMIRFRPNLVVSGCGPYAEDHWRKIRIGDLTLRVVKPCSRCKITTVDPGTGETGSEPLKTLSGYRREGNRVFFGQNLVHEGTGELALDMPVEVVD